MKKTLFFATLFLFISIGVFSQSTSFIKKEFSLVGGAAMGKINNDNIKNDPFAVSSNAVTPNFGINFANYFTKNIGVLIGLEYNRFKNTTTYDEMYRSPDLSVDQDKVSYYKQYNAHYKDIRTLNTIDIPLALRLQTYNDQFQVFVDLGIKANITLNSTFEEKGDYETSSAYPLTYYPNQYILVEKNSYYGLSSTSYNINHELGTKRLNYSAIVSGGIKAKLSDGAFLMVSGGYMRGLTDIMNSDNHTDYVTITKDKLAYKKFTLTQFFLKIGVGLRIS